MIQKFLKAVLYSSFVFAIHPPLHAQSIGDWEIYSSYSTINSVSFDNVNTYYVLTKGGLFVVEDDIIISRYTTIDGMHRLDAIESIFDELNNRLIIAYTDGVIDVFNVDNESFEKIDDIARVNEFTSKMINHFEFQNNELVVATDFGVVVFDRNQLYVTNSYLNIGEFPRGSTVYDVTFYDDSIFVATSQGIASALSSSNLVDANEWNTKKLSESNNLEVTEVEESNTFLLAISDDSLYSWNNGAWKVLDNQPLNNPSILESYEDEILIGNINKIQSISENNETTDIFVSDKENITTIRSINSDLLIGTRENGLIELTSSSQIFKPSGPYLNFFSETELKDGILLASSTSQFPQSDPFNNIRGYYIYNNGWENYNRNTNTTLDEFSYAMAYTIDITDDDYFIGSWGDGIAIHSRLNNEIRVFDTTNSDFTGISANSSYIVISGIDTDSFNNTWVISFLSDLPLNVYSKESDEWTHFSSLPINNDELYFRLFVDSKNKLWIPLIDVSNNGKGLLIIDTGQNVFDESDDTYRKLTLSVDEGNLPDNNVIAIAEDKNGEIWIGTERGIARFIFPDFIVSTNNPSEYTAQWLINADTSATSRFLLRDINVSSIAVNSANQKWVGSVNQGIWLLNEDGSEIIARFTAENSPLISNNIEDITIDNERGVVYISTDLGLISLVETAKKPVNTLRDLKVYPNPFVYSKHDEVIIDDLSDQTTIKIVGADGSVFNSFQTKGGRHSWDGLDEYGKELSSGVYFVVAIADNGSEKGIGKIVIIR
jgi:hypothetical protein